MEFVLNRYCCGERFEVAGLRELGDQLRGIGNIDLLIEDARAELEVQAEFEMFAEEFLI